MIFTKFTIQFLSTDTVSLNLKQFFVEYVSPIKLNTIKLHRLCFEKYCSLSTSFPTFIHWSSYISAGLVTDDKPSRSISKHVVQIKWDFICHCYWFNWLHAWIRPWLSPTAIRCERHGFWYIHRCQWCCQQLWRLFKQPKFQSQSKERIFKSNTQIRFSQWEMTLKSFWKWTNKITNSITDVNFNCGFSYNSLDFDCALSKWSNIKTK